MKSNLAVVDTSVDNRGPVSVDFVEASMPRSDLAKDLHLQFDTLTAAGNAGNLRVAGNAKGAIIAVNPFFVGIKPGWNLRDHESRENIEHVKSLAVSIAEFGVKEALTVHPADGKYWVTDGHCRYLAVMHAINHLGAQIVSIPIKLEDKSSSEAERIAGQLVRNSGKSYAPLEKARVCRKLEGFGWGVKKIGSALGVSPSRVEQLLKLHASTSMVIEKMISDDVVTASFAARVIKQAGGDVGRAEEVLNEAVSVARSHGKSRASGKHLRLVHDGHNKVRTMAPSAPTDIVSSFVPDNQISGTQNDDKASAPTLQNPTVQKLLKQLFRSASVTLSDGIVSAVFDDKSSTTLCQILDLQ